MAWTQSQLDALDVAISKGTRTVSYGDKTVTYHTLDEMLKLRAQMMAEIAAAAGMVGRFSRVSFNRD